MSGSEPPTITRTPSQINGVAVIAIEPALAPHPHPAHNGKLVPFRGVYKVLLEDGSETYLCAGTDGAPCDKTDPNPKAIASHRAGMHPKVPRAKSLYPEVVLRRVLTEAAKARQVGLRGYLQRTAEAMNASQFRPLNGDTWTGSIVHSIVAAHGDRIKVRVPTRPRSGVAQRPVQKIQPPVNNTQVGLQSGDLEAIQTFVVIAPVLAKALERVAAVVEHGLSASAEALDKARRWDEMQQLLNGRMIG